MQRQRNKKRPNQKIKVATKKKLKNVEKLGKPTKGKRQALSKMLAEAKKQKELEALATESALKEHEDKDL
jgi:hypothetical protein